MALQQQNFTQYLKPEITNSMEEYGRLAIESINSQWNKGINPAIYLDVEYFKTALDELNNNNK